MSMAMPRANAPLICISCSDRDSGSNQDNNYDTYADREQAYDGSSINCGHLLIPVSWVMPHKKVFRDPWLENNKALNYQDVAETARAVTDGANILYDAVRS